MQKVSRTLDYLKEEKLSQHTVIKIKIRKVNFTLLPSVSKLHDYPARTIFFPTSYWNLNFSFYAVRHYKEWYTQFSLLLYSKTAIYYFVSTPIRQEHWKLESCIWALALSTCNLRNTEKRGYKEGLRISIMISSWSWPHDHSF